MHESARGPEGVVARQREQRGVGPADLSEPAGQRDGGPEREDESPQGCRHEQVPFFAERSGEAAAEERAGGKEQAKRDDRHGRGQCFEPE